MGIWVNTYDIHNASTLTTDKFEFIWMPRERVVRRYDREGNCDEAKVTVRPPALDCRTAFFLLEKEYGGGSLPG